MLADDCAPSHAAALAEALSHACEYAESLSAMVESGRPDPEKAHQLVQAIRNMLCTAEDELENLDDTQAIIEAAIALRGITDPGPIIGTPTPGNP